MHTSQFDKISVVTHLCSQTINVSMKSAKNPDENNFQRTDFDRALWKVNVQFVTQHLHLSEHATQPADLSATLKVT